MVKHKKILKSSFIYVFLGFLAPAVNFFLLPIYTRYLDKADYAFITLALLVQTVLTPLLHVGMTGAFSRFYYDHLNDRRSLEKLLSTTLIFFVFVGLFFWGICSLAGSWAFDKFFANEVFTFSRYGYYILVTAIVMNIQLLVLTYYRNEEMAGKYALWSVLFFLSAASSIYIGVAVLKMGADGSIQGRMWGSVITLIPLFLFFFSGKSLNFDWKLCRTMLVYALPLVPYILLNIAFTNFDKVLVEQKFSLSQLGEYGFAVLVASVVEIFINSVQSAVYPQVFRFLSINGKSDANIADTFKFTIIINALVIAALISFTGIILHAFIDERYWDIMDYFPLLCLVYIPRLIFTVWGLPVMFFKKTKYLPFANSISLVTGVFVGLGLIDSLGIFALPLSLFVVQLLQCCLIFFLNNHLNIQLLAFRRLTPEYFVLFFLLIAGLGATYSYHYLYTNVLVYIPVFFLILLLVLALNFRSLKLLWHSVNLNKVVNKGE